MRKVLALLAFVVVACGCEPGYVDPSIEDGNITNPSDSTDVTDTPLLPDEGDDSNQSNSEVWGEGEEVIL